MSKGSLMFPHKDYSQQSGSGTKDSGWLPDRLKWSRIRSSTLNPSRHGVTPVTAPGGVEAAPMGDMTGL